MCKMCVGIFVISIKLNGGTIYSVIFGVSAEETNNILNYKI